MTIAATEYWTPAEMAEMVAEMQDRHTPLPRTAKENVELGTTLPAPVRDNPAQDLRQRLINGSWM